MTGGYFASRSLLEHIARGGVAAVLLWWAVQHQHATPWWALGAGAVAMLALRGCPICWAIGLVETVKMRR